MGKYTLTRKWESSKEEKAFEKLLQKEGFKVVGIKEYQSKTDYLIEKDGTQVRFDFLYIGGGLKQAKLSFNSLVRLYEVKKQYDALIKC